MSVDKRKEANLRVKRDITKAMLALMHEKSFSEISISEIVRRAKVARASFYRNYTSKEDVLLTIIRDAIDYFRETAEYDLSNYYTYAHIVRCFEHFKMYAEYILDLCTFGYGEYIREELNHFHEEIAGSMPSNSIDKYKLYIFIGALYNTAVVWVQNGVKESPEEIAKVFCREVGIEQ